MDLFLIPPHFAPWYTTGVDTVGGVRVPAGFCGVLGFRPSYGAVSHNGIIPVSKSLDTVGMDDSIIDSLFSLLK